MTDIEQEARAEAKRIVNADVVLAAVRTIGIGLSAARGAPERAVAISNTRVRLARLIDQIEGQAHPASPATPPEADADSDTAFELGRVAGYDEAMREVGASPATREAVADLAEGARMPSGGTLLGSRAQFLALADALLSAFSITEKGAES